MRQPFSQHSSPEPFSQLSKGSNSKPSVGPRVEIHSRPEVVPITLLASPVCRPIRTRTGCGCPKLRRGVMTRGNA